MNDHRHICLHHGIKQALSESGRDTGLRRQFSKAIDLLEARQFTHGLWVKKLRNLRRTVLEARLNHAERLLFDYATRYCPKCKETKPFIRLLDYVPDHDAVDRRAHQLNRTFDDQGFEDWDEASEEYQIGDAAQDALTLQLDRTKLDSAQLPGYLQFRQSGDYALLDGEFIEDGVQWYRTDDDNFNRLIEQGAAELRLLLTEEQATYLQARGPLLMNGSAGSGKTTLGIYRSLERLSRNPDLRALYVTYSRNLVSDAQDLCRALAPRIVIPSDLGRPGIFFVQFRDLCHHLIGNDLSQPGQRLATFRQFTEWFRERECQYRKYQDLEPALAWDEIRSVLRGSIPGARRSRDAFLATEMLTLEEYLEVGDKVSRVPKVDRETRRLIYDLASIYEEHLSANDKYDEMSLTREAMRKLRQAPFDLVIADEVQDLTELQIELLARLVPVTSSGEGLFLVGDLQQVINPSSFRWEDVRKIFYIRQELGWQVPELHKLTHNFRSRGPIVDLANRILDLRRQAVGKYADEAESEASVHKGGTRPCICQSDARIVIKALRRLEVKGIDIIVLTPEIRDWLQAELGSKSVWTIQEAKGLEFVDVLLWKMAESGQEVWQEFIAVGGKKEGPRSAVAHQFNLLYVAVTRARRQVAIFEEIKRPYPWFQLLSEELLDRVEAADLGQYLVAPSTREQWRSRGEYLLEQERYEQAIEAFRKAGNVQLEETALACWAGSEGRLDAAAVHWETIQHYREAAGCWARAGAFDKAAADWEKAQEWHQAAELWEQAGQLLNAANVWLTIGQWKNAIRCYQNAGQPEIVRQCEAAQAESIGDWNHAARLWVELEDWQAAARCYQQLGEYHIARRCEAQLAEKREGWAEAGSIWEELENWQRAKVAYECAGQTEAARRCEATFAEAEYDWMRAAKIWRDLESWEEAAECYRRAGKSQSVHKCKAKLAESEGHWTDAARIWQHLERWDDAARCYREAKKVHLADHCIALSAEANADYRRAAEIWSRSMSWEDAARCHEEAGDHRAARVCQAELAESKDAWGAAAAIWEGLELWPRARNAYLKAGHEREAHICEAKHAEATHDWHTAAEVWASLDALDEASRCLRLTGDLRATCICAALSAEKEGQWAEAAGLWEKAQDWARAVRLYRCAGLETQARQCESDCSK